MSIWKEKKRKENDNVMLLFYFFSVVLLHKKLFHIVKNELKIDFDDKIS